MCCEDSKEKTGWSKFSRKTGLSEEQIALLAANGCLSIFNPEGPLVFLLLFRFIKIKDRFVGRKYILQSYLILAGSGQVIGESGDEIEFVSAIQTKDRTYLLKFRWKGEDYLTDRFPCFAKAIGIIPELQEK